MGGHRVQIEGMRYAEKFVVLKPEGNRMLGRPDHNINNIKMNLKEIISELDPSSSKQG